MDVEQVKRQAALKASAAELRRLSDEERERADNIEELGPIAIGATLAGTPAQRGKVTRRRRAHAEATTRAEQFAAGAAVLEAAAEVQP